MIELPLDRLHYYNGQRLDAPAFKLEQDYHIRVRRWLNRSLYSAGIARGLEVRAEPGSVPTVVVSPGLALDVEGREIILVDEQRVPVVGMGSAVDGQVTGNYLSIQYHEQTEAEQQDGCQVAAGARHPAEHPAWGGPGRVRSEPILAWSDILPHQASGRVVLAQVELDATCRNIRHIHVEARQYVGAASTATVRQYALEGEKDLDTQNSKQLFFHIRGRQPSSVTLYLRADRLSTLLYTEMGEHNHGVQVGVDPLVVPAHSHGMASGNTGAGSSHAHTVSSVTADADRDVWSGVIGLMGVSNPLTWPAVGAAEAALWLGGAFNAGTGANLALSPRPFRSLNGDELTTRVNMHVTVDGENQHTHSIPSPTNPYPASGADTTFNLSGSGGSSNAPTGRTAADVAYAARNGRPLVYFDGLQVLVDGVDVTAAVIRQLKDVRPPNENWDKLGDGSASHALVQSGTGPIKLHFLPNVAFGQGEHLVELKPNGGGGRVLYNLYVE